MVLAALGAFVGGRVPLLEPMLAVLALSWDICGRSWAALGAYVGGLGPLLGHLLAVLGRLGPKSGPGPSGKAIWQAGQAEKWPKPERESDLASGSRRKSYVA